MIATKKYILMAGILCMPATFFAGPLGKKIGRYCKGAAVHLLNHRCANMTTISCPASQVRNQRKLFGYDLGIEYYQHAEDRFYRPRARAILYLHPWGVIALPNKKHMHMMKLDNVLPGDVITFNFPDGVMRGPLPSLYSSFGQLSDVLPAIYTLNYAYEVYGLHTIDVFGYSRGGAVAVNMVAVLHDKSTQYDAALAQLGITAGRRKELLAAIERGSIVLDCPLIDGNETLKNYAKPVQFIARTMTNYKSDGLQALQSARSLSGLKLHVLLHFQYNDTRIGNEHEAALYNAFAQHNPEHTYLLLADEGGHIHSYEALSRAVQVFYKKIGAAYDQQLLADYETSLKLERKKGAICVAMQPSVAQSEQVISSFHRSCEKK